MNLKLAALVAATLWGFTYIISATMLPHNPMFIAAVRALGGGLALLLIARQWPPAGAWWRLIVLGTLNFALFFSLLFVGALRLPGGIAGTFQTLTPLASILLVWMLMGQKPSVLRIVSVLIGAAGVALVILRGDAALDAVGVAAALSSMLAGSLGGVLVSKWGRPPGLSMLGFTGWQLVIAGAELVAVTLVARDIPASLSGINLLGLALVALALTALPFTLWFRAIAGLGAAGATPFILVTPIVAFVLDAAIRGVVPSLLQSAGVVLVLVGLVLNQWTGARRPAAAPTPPA